KVSAIEKRIAAYEKVKKEAGVDYYNYIILPDYKVLKKIFDKAYDTLKSFNRNNGYGDDNKYKEEEFIRKNQPQIDRTELLKNVISNQENRVKIAERLLSEAKKANEKTKAMRDLQTEQSALAESKAYFRIYNLKIAKAKAKAIKIKLSFSDALGIAEINPAKLFNRLYKKEATLSKKIDSGKYDNSINFSKMKNEQKELFNQMNDLTKNITEDDFYKHLAHNLCCSYEDFKPE
ncbi:hypothetical protein DNC80_10130, partial [Flavobacterium sp. SOK18b]|uniref:hypothetical protein n=1 Tax=Flavobacterium sp. SOK18b TaxID=797900 RepID=UPI0015FD37EC